MKIYQKRLIERNKLKYVLCNKCGKNIDIKQYEDFLNISKDWGYNSSFDNEIHEIEICQSCYNNFLSDLKIEPKKLKRKKFFSFL